MHRAVQMMGTSSLSVLLLATATVGLPAKLSALEPEDVLILQKGSLSLRPQFALAEQYNDNVFYEQKSPVQDFITIVSPGLKLQLGRPEHNFISLGYTLDEFFYAENPDLNTGQHSFELRNQLDGEHLKLVGSDRIQLLSNPLGGVVERVVVPGEIQTISGVNVDRTVFDDNYTLSYDIGDKTGVYLRANHASTDYQKGVALYDIRTLTGTGGFGYRAFPKTVLFGEIYYGQTTTDPNDPSLRPNPRLDFVGAYLGARGNFTAKLSGMAKLGYEIRSFADGTSAPSEPVVDLALTERFTEKRSLALTYSRANNVSVQYSRQTYTADIVGLTFLQTMGEKRKWQATIGGSYALYNYDKSGFESVASEYSYLRGSLGLAYQIQRWLTASLGYDHDRVSGRSTAAIDYNVNRVTLRLAIGY